MHLCFYKRIDYWLVLLPSARLEHHIEIKAWVKWCFIVLMTYGTDFCFRPGSSSVILPLSCPS